MKPNPDFLWMLALAAIMAASGGPVFADELPAGVARQTLLKKSVSLPTKDVETRVIRVRFPSGYKTPLHTHEGPGPRYVLNGRLRVEDSGQVNTYGPGDVFWETGGAMTVESIGGSDAEMVIVELAPVGEAGKP